MTFEETLALLYLAKRLFPRDKSLGKDPREMSEIGEAWSEMLKDIPFGVGKSAVGAHAASSPYAPAISEIRAYARKLTHPREMTGEEAYAIAMKTIRRFGNAPYKDFATGKYPYERARENTPPEVWRVMDMLGYNYMCKSERPETIHNQFIEAWERQQKRREEQTNMAPFLPPALKEKVLAIGEGQSDACAHGARDAAPAAP